MQSPFLSSLSLLSFWKNQERGWKYMVIIGIDVAKDSLVGVRIDRSSCVKETYLVTNTKASIETFLTKVAKKWKKLVIGSEATAEYHRELALQCIARDIPFRLLNPITTKQFTRATVRKRKTDLTDAQVIAKLLLQGEGSMVTKESFTLTKPAIRTAAKLSQMRQMLLLMKQRLHSIGMDDELIKQLDTCMTVLKETEQSYEHYAAVSQSSKLSKLLQTIPGIGPTTATRLLAEIGDINKFSTGKRLVAFCGLDPKVKQSGTGLHRNTHLTKRGSPYFRKAIFFAASIAQMHDAELKEYYEKKRQEGKQYKEATVAVARKLLYRVYAVWKRQTPYTV
ncbi:MAG: IS110 family transposase [Nitrospirae bacterium]|nr:MAG: IS110 family transposase [Nitrospirota bacterium]